MHVLDTDHMSILEWTQNPIAQRLRARLKSYAADEIATTIITYEEQMRGWMGELARSPKMMDQVEVYQRLRRHVENYRTVHLVDFDERAASQFQSLCKQYRRIKRMDLKIAAIVLSRQATLLTRNFGDFGQIAGLKIEDWTRE